MGVRFNKRMTIFPWLKMNVGKSGVSLTIGPKGKTLNVGSTGVNVNVSLGKGVGYSKRLITWKKLNLLSMIGLGTAAATKKTSKKNKKGGETAAKNGKGTTVPTLDEAIAEAEAEAAGTTQNTQGGGNSVLTEQPGCSWGCAAVGCLALIVIVALLAVVAYLLWQQYGGTLLTTPGQ